MIIKFSNLGAIKETELDLRPLTVIIGPNNSNKTYIAYSVYGLWKAIRTYYGDLYKFEYFPAPLDGSLISVEWSHNLWRKIIQRYEGATNKFTNNLTTYFQDSSSKIFSTTKYEIIPSEEETKYAFESLAGKEITIWGSAYSINVVNGFLTAHSSDNENTPSALPSAVQNMLIETLFPQAFVLPAERNAIILTYKYLQNNRFQLLRDQQRGLFAPNGKVPSHQEQGDIRFPEPIEDFLDALNEIELDGKINNEEGRAFQEIASLIEKEIQGNHRTQFRPTRLSGKELVVKVSKDLTIDLYNASSSIKQLAPLLLYLRYRARENNLLIIEEPEMNLHPESQVKLLEILAMLVNAGVKVLLTTHSPYFLAHLNNLAQDEEKPESVRKRQATSLYLKDPRAFLSMEQVSAYEMKDNELVSLKDPDYGIRWDTLSDVSVDVNRKYFEIYEKGKVNGRARKSKQTAQTEAG